MVLQNLVGNLQGLFGGAVPKQTVTAKQGFKSYVTIEDGDVDYNTAAEVYGAVGAAGIWTTIWEMTIPAQQLVHWGYGSPNQPQNQGYMWFAMLQAGVAFTTGTLRLVQQNARRLKTVPVAEISDQLLHSVDNTSVATAALINKNEMIALPEKVEFDLVGEDSRIALQYRMATAGVEDAAGFQIPITVYQ